MGLVLIALLAVQKPQLAPISIQLSAPKRAYKLGEEVIFAAHVKNHTKQAIELVTEQDSMNWRRKAPYCTLEAKQPNGTWEPLLMKGVGRCGNSNPLKLSDFVEIQPSKSAEILQGMPWTKYEVKECLAAKGTYTVHLRYDSTPDFKNWIGGPLMDEAEQKLITQLRPHYERTPKGVFVSNEVTIKIQ